MKKAGERLFQFFIVLLLMFGFFSQEAAANSVSGLWEPGPNFPFFPVHLHLLPDGKIMIWPGDGGVNGDDPRLYDPDSGSVTSLPNAGFDIFCSGHSYLPDGRLFVAGGHIQNNVGLPDATIYNPFTNTWSRQPQMNLGRWYPTTQMLPNGDVVVLSGDVDITTGSNPLPQVWQIATSTWRSLTNAQLKLPLYPYLFLGPSGRVFYAGPGVSTRYLDTAGTGAWSFVGNHVFTARSRTYGAAVMYQPGKIMNVGGGDPPTAVTEVIDLNVTSPQWRNTQPMANARRHMNATLLPDGKVLATGGTKGAGFNDETASNLIFAAEMWDPATETWSTMASASYKRLYHSIAILLPDGRVLSTGGNGVTQTEFYSPPYLFAGPRPTLSSAPEAVGKGQSFFVGTPDATTVDTVSWIKIGSVTHTVNMNQGSFRTSSFTRQADGITITAPNLTTVTAGHYMLFLLRGGVPSVAKIVRLDNNQVNNPVPSLTSMTPNSAAAGGPAFTLTVNGSNFATGSAVRWNGADRPTTFVSATQLRAAIPASDITAAGTAQVTVFNPTPGGGTSSALTFTVTAAANPVPSLTSIAPTSAAAGGSAFTLTANGSNFVAGSVVRWKGADRTTTFVSATQLRAAIPAGDIAAAGTAQVTVFNPTPGGGISTAQTFTITSGGSGTPNLATIGTPIARVTAPTGSGSKSLETIRDGIKPAVNSTSSTTQYDTYDGVNTSPNEWIGYQFGSPQTFSRVMFQEGRHFTGGGWFTTLTVQVLQSGVWVNVPNVTSSPAYPGVNNGVTYESYTLQFPPISGDGIRVFGDPGGSNDFISVGELEVYGDTSSNPVPNLTSIAPTSAAAGGPAFTLTANGNNFVAGSVVRWNGTDRSTTFVSATQLRAAIPAGDIAAAGTAQVTVFTPTPAGGTSSSLGFTITAAATPVPNLTSMTPTKATAGGSAFTLTVNGSNFVAGSTVRWNGTNRPTTFVSATQLRAAIPASDIAESGTAQVTVFNPAPGGGTSAAETFTIRRRKLLGL